MAAGQDAGTLCDGLVDLALERVEEVAAGQRPNLRRALQRVAHRRAATASTKRCSNSSATVRSTMKRLAARQLWRC